MLRVRNWERAQLGHAHLGVFPKVAPSPVTSREVTMFMAREWAATNEAVTQGHCHLRDTSFLEHLHLQGDLYPLIQTI